MGQGHRQRCAAAAGEGQEHGRSAGRSERAGEQQEGGECGRPESFERHRSYVGGDYVLDARSPNSHSRNPVHRARWKDARSTGGVITSKICGIICARPLAPCSQCRCVTRLFRQWPVTFALFPKLRAEVAVYGTSGGRQMGEPVGRAPCCVRASRAEWECRCQSLRS